MSDENTTVTTDTNVTDAKVKRTRTKSERTDFTKIIAAHAKKRNIDTTRAGKEVRAKARREFAHLCKLDPSLAKVKSAANDGNRWPALNGKAREYLLTSKRAS
jgi:hypothetical protein